MKNINIIVNQLIPSLFSLALLFAPVYSYSSECKNHVAGTTNSSVLDTSISRLYLPHNVVKILQSQNINTLRDIIQKTEAQLISDGLNPQQAHRVKLTVMNKGYSLQEEPPQPGIIKRTVRSAVSTAQVAGDKIADSPVGQRVADSSVGQAVGGVLGRLRKPSTETTETKPADTQQPTATAKPAETKPAEETQADSTAKPAETKPTAEETQQPPADTTATAKPAGTQQTAEAKPDATATAKPAEETSQPGFIRRAVRGTVSTVQDVGDVLKTAVDHAKDSQPDQPANNRVLRGVGFTARMTGSVAGQASQAAVNAFGSFRRKPNSDDTAENAPHIAQLKTELQSLLEEKQKFEEQLSSLSEEAQLQMKEQGAMYIADLNNRITAKREEIKQAEETQAETKPADTQQPTATAKPAETKPTEETQADTTAETQQPTAEAKPAETKPAEETSQPGIITRAVRGTVSTVQDVGDVLKTAVDHARDSQPDQPANSRTQQVLRGVGLTARVAGSVARQASQATVNAFGSLRQPKSDDTAETKPAEETQADSTAKPAAETTPTAEETQQPPADTTATAKPAGTQQTAEAKPDATATAKPAEETSQPGFIRRAVRGTVSTAQDVGDVLKTAVDHARDSQPDQPANSRTQQVLRGVGLTARVAGNVAGQASQATVNALGSLRKPNSDDTAENAPHIAQLKTELQILLEERKRFEGQMDSLSPEAQFHLKEKRVMYVTDLNNRITAKREEIKQAEETQADATAKPAETKTTAEETQQPPADTTAAAKPAKTQADSTAETQQPTATAKPAEETSQPGFIRRAVRGTVSTAQDVGDVLKTAVDHARDSQPDQPANSRTQQVLRGVGLTARVAGNVAGQASQATVNALGSLRQPKPRATYIHITLDTPLSKAYISKDIVHILNNHKVRTLRDLTQTTEAQLAKFGLNDQQTHKIKLALSRRGFSLKPSLTQRVASTAQNVRSTVADSSVGQRVAGSTVGQAVGNVVDATGDVLKTAVDHARDSQPDQPANSRTQQVLRGVGLTARVAGSVAGQASQATVNALGSLRQPKSDDTADTKPAEETQQPPADTTATAKPAGTQQTAEAKPDATATAKPAEETQQPPADTAENTPHIAQPKTTMDQIKQAFLAENAPHIAQLKTELQILLEERKRFDDQMNSLSPEAQFHLREKRVMYVTDLNNRITAKREEIRQAKETQANNTTAEAKPDATATAKPAEETQQPPADTATTAKPAETQQTAEAKPDATATAKPAEETQQPPADTTATAKPAGTQQTAEAKPDATATAKPAEETQQPPADTTAVAKPAETQQTVADKSTANIEVLFNLSLAGEASIVKSLKNQGISSIAELEALSQDDLLQIRGIGRASVNRIQDKLNQWKSDNQS